MTPTRDDKAYAAGLFDGEGCVIIRAQAVAKGTRSSVVLRVSIANTYFPVHSWLRARWGGHVSRRDRPSRDGFLRRPIGEWILTSRAAWAFLSDIVPFVVIKKAQVENAVAFQAMKRQPGRTRGLTAEQRRAELRCVTLARELKEA